jgi:hypothetical protein
LLQVPPRRPGRVQANKGAGVARVLGYQRG